MRDTPATDEVPLSDIAPATQMLLDAATGKLVRARGDSSGNSSVTLGTRLDSVNDSVAIGAGEAHIGEVGTPLLAPSATFTRPNDANPYASGDLSANNTAAGSVVAMALTAARVAAGGFSIRRIRLKKSTTSLTNASFRVHFYDTDPALSSGITNGDNGAWLTKHAGYMGSCDITMDKAFSDAAGGNGIPAIGTEISDKLASGTTVYALLEVRAAYTPGNSEVFTLIVEVFPT